MAIFSELSVIIHLIFQNWTQLAMFEWLKDAPYFEIILDAFEFLFGLIDGCNYDDHRF